VSVIDSVAGENAWNCLITVALTIVRAYVHETVMTSWIRAHWGVAPKYRVAPVILTSLCFACSAWGQQPVGITDPTEPLRRFPITIMVRRPEFGAERVSLLRVPTLRPKDDLQVVVDDRLQGNWTLVEAFVEAGQKIGIKSWNLWEKRWREKPIELGPLPDRDVVPLFFLTLNRRQERHVLEAVRHALETSSQLILSQTATFETIFRQQNRLLNFMTAYAALGPKVTPDPVSLKNRADDINLDLGATYDPTVQNTSPGQMQHGLDATVGLLNAFRESPDDPAPAAALTRSQVPGVVSDWISLVGDLMHVFIKPPKDVKLTMVPGSAVEIDPGLWPESHSMTLVTQRVLETRDDSLPSIVFRPNFSRADGSKPITLSFAHQEVLAETREVAIPLGQDSRELFLHPYAWKWEISEDGKQFSQLMGAHLMPGRGLVFPISSEWWGPTVDRTLYVQARVGFQVSQPKKVEIARIKPQMWAVQAPEALDIASGDPAVTVHLDRSGQAQPFYRFESVMLTDSAGKVFSAKDIRLAGSLSAEFNLSGASPGTAVIRVQQENQAGQDPPVEIFIAPKHPSISIFCGKGDRVLRISGPEATWVKSVKASSLYVQETDDSEAGNRRLTLSGALPLAVHNVTVTYKDPQRGLEWTIQEPVSVGLPRPRVGATVVGTVPSSVAIGSGPDPTWAMATMPPGWFRTREPVRVQLAAVSPFSWTHEVALDLGFGSAGDVQKVLSVPEGPIFSMDQVTPNAYLTLDLDTALLKDSRRNTGLLWLKLTRADLASPWTLVTVETPTGAMPLRAVKLPGVQAFDAGATGCRLTLSNCDQVLGVKFAGQAGFTPPQFLDSGPGGLTATVDGPAGATEFDIELRDASEGVIHVKVTKKP